MEDVELHRIPTAELEAELVRRRKGEWREKPSPPLPFCDPCGNFIPFRGDPSTPIPEAYNPCANNHPMRFRVPQTMGDVHEGNWGFYKHRCPDRKPA